MPERLFRHNEIHIHAEMRPIRTAAMNSFSFADFLKTPQGETLHAWESSQYDEFSADAFGREALQVGAPQLDTLRANGITSQWLTSESYDELDNRLLRPTLQTVQAESGWLPFPAESLDLVTLPHALDFAPSAHQTLREAARVLVPEGRLILTVFNPLSLWWMRQKAVGAGLRPYLPTHTSPVPLYRLKDWLTLLGFEIDRGRFGVYSPSCHSLRNFERWKWLDKAGDRWAPHCANLIVLCAVKRLPGMKLVGRRARRSPFPRRPDGRRDTATDGTLSAFSTVPQHPHMAQQTEKTLEIWTDGACKCNPGIGGWGAYMVWGAHTREMYGGSKLTTNNQMELTAVISALSALRRKCPIIIHTDSSYVKDGITKWIHGWKRNGWRTADKKPVKNAELWQQLDELTSQFDIEWRWVKGHAGDPGNEKADELANMGCEVAAGTRPAPSY